MKITDKLNEIEQRVKELAGEAEKLSTQKESYESLLECSVNGHNWELVHTEGNLQKLTHLEVTCTVCDCYSGWIGPGYATTLDKALHVYLCEDGMMTDIRISSMIPEEGEN